MIKKFKVLKPFEIFNVGDEVSFSLRQAQYRLLSGHIAAIPTEAKQIDEPELIMKADIQEPEINS